MNKKAAASLFAPLADSRANIMHNKRSEIVKAAICAFVEVLQEHGIGRVSSEGIYEDYKFQIEIDLA